jgi:nucleoid-associated protein YgaU
LYATQPVLADKREPRSAPAAGAGKGKLSTENEKNPPARTASLRTDVASSDAPTEYIVVAGDTLSHIALKYRLKWEKIYEANRTTVKNPNYIYVGQRIIIPS